MGATQDTFYIKKHKNQEKICTFHELNEKNKPETKNLTNYFFRLYYNQITINQKAKKMVRTTKKQKQSIARRVWSAICFPFKKIWAFIVRIWNWIANINMGALLNVTLLVSIIVLFTLLIIDLRKGANASDNEILLNSNRPIVLRPLDNQNANSATPRVVPRPKKIATLPIKHDNTTRKASAQPIQVAKTPENPVAVAQVAKQGNNAYGPVVIDHYDMRNVVKNGAHIQGDLYIQDMRKYTLPCDIVIDGNLFLRDVNMLNFCGDFTVRGNIYVSPRSSFGPVPSTARIGGQVIL